MKTNKEYNKLELESKKLIYQEKQLDEDISFHNEKMKVVKVLLSNPKIKKFCWTNGSTTVWSRSKTCIAISPVYPENKLVDYVKNEIGLQQISCHEFFEERER